MKPFTSTIFILLMTLFYLSAGDDATPREKNIRIGVNNWYTAYNNLDQMLTVALKAEKPILAVFSDPTSGSSGRVVQGILKSSSFSLVAGRAVLLHIEKTDPRAKEYLEKFKVQFFPAVRLISKEGKQLDNGDSTLLSRDRFLNWASDSISGNYSTASSKKPGGNAQNRIELMKEANETEDSQWSQKADLFRQVIRLNPDIFDPLTQEAYERLAAMLSTQLRWFRDPKDRKMFVQLYDEEFMTAIYSYYPNLFKHKLNTEAKYVYILSWLNAGEKFSGGMTYYRDFIKSMEGKDRLKYFSKYYVAFKEAIFLLLNNRRESEAETWLDKVSAVVEEVKNSGEQSENRMRGYLFRLFRMYDPFIDFYSKNKDLQQAEAYAQQAIQLMKKVFKDKEIDLVLKARWAKAYGVYAHEYLSEIDKELSKERSANTVQLTCEKAYVYAKMGKEDDARDLLVRLADNLLPGYGPEGEVLNRIAYSMVEAGIVTRDTVDMAKKSLKLKTSAARLDTLASAYAALGKYAKAVEVQQKAVLLTRKGRRKDMFNRKLMLWEKANGMNEQTPAPEEPPKTTK
ncbi:MAG: tetratricopeptide repeat protein [bacterium]|nr:tetratricopeptide repeat protein [bacterium]